MYSAQTDFCLARTKAKIADIARLFVSEAEQHLLQDVMAGLNHGLYGHGFYFTASFQEKLMAQISDLSFYSDDIQHLATGLIKFFYTFTRVEYFLMTRSAGSQLQQPLIEWFFICLFPIMQNNFYKIFWLFNEGAEQRIEFHHIFPGNQAEVNAAYSKAIRRFSGRRRSLADMQWKLADRQFRSLAEAWQSKEGIEAYSETVNMMQLFLILPRSDYREYLRGVDDDASTMRFVKNLKIDYFELLRQLCFEKTGRYGALLGFPKEFFMDYPDQ